MGDADRWGVVAEAATMLDAADWDWRALQQVEGLLSSLSTEIEQVTRVETQHASTGHGAPDADLRCLQHLLTWVRRHEYDALESELHHELDIALRCAMNALDGLERRERDTRLSSFRLVGSGDGR
jgi:hypothetical protein